MSYRIKPLSRTLPLCGALLCVSVALVSSAPASAANIPCWKKLLTDWYDGSISKIYPLPCYHEAINHLPADVKVYSSAKDDILNALAAASKHQTAPPEKTTAQATTGTSSTSTNSTTSTTSTTSTAPATTPTTTDRIPPKKKKGISEAFAKLTPGGPDAFPLPLLILGALALLLVAAGAAGMIWRRLQERGPGTP